MQRTRWRRVARCSRAAVLVITLIGAGTAFAANEAGGPLHWPLADAHHALTGGFGESRTNRFHAGLDLSTGGQVGAEVLAPAAVTLERVRTSGVGYGRSLYLRMDDGRLVLFGHLDAFAPAIAAWVDSVQRATGQYEQDLWPPEGRFRFAAGSRVAWSGQSGAGPPHLHVEVRHGDMAVNPLLAGLAVADTVPPRLEELILEPLDEASWVQRCAAPHTLKLDASGAGARHGEDTLLVEGHVRLTLVASDMTNASRKLPVRTAGARWGGAWVECHMDSVSWAGEMIQYAWLVDRDRVTGSGGVILDAPAGFRPRFLASSRPDSDAVDLVHVAAGDPPRALELYARDAAGNEVKRRVWLRGPHPAERGPDTSAVKVAASASGSARGKPAGRGKPAAHGTPAASAASAPASPPRWTFACLPAQRVRVRVTGVPRGVTGVHLDRGNTAPEGGEAAATWDGAGWCAVLNLNGMPDDDGLWIKARGADGKAWWNRGAYTLWPTASLLVAHLEDWGWFDVDPGSAYEPGAAMVRSTLIDGLPPGATGVRAAMDAQPASTPLKKAIDVTLVLPPGLPHDRTGMCRRDDAGAEWEWNDARWDSVTRTLRLSTARLGQFALVRDVAAPEVTPLPAPTTRRGGPYSTWALTARALDRLSGVVADASAFTVDGKRVPTEYDAEEHVLRWRPLAMPRAGRHAWRLEVEDHAGNRTVRSGTFVIASR